MSTSAPREVVLGCDPQVTVRIFEDAGNLMLQVTALDPATTDIDGIFFNLVDDSLAQDVTIYPKVNAQEITDFDVETGALNQMNNGATLSQSYDVKVEFGTLPSTSQGDVDQAAFTLYLDGEAPLTAADIDLSNLTVVVNSDNGAGLALTNGEGSYEPVVTTVLEEDFEGIWDPSHSADVVRDDGWDIRHGQAYTDGCNDGMLKFAAVQTTDKVALNIDMRAEGLRNFENSGWSEDSLRLEVQIDGGAWVLLDEFQVNDAHTAMVGSETGQSFDGDLTTLSYSGGVLDTATQDVQFRLVSDITASDERIYVDNVEVLTIDDTPPAAEPGATVEQEEDFDGLWDPSHSAEIVRDDGWDIRHGQAYTDGCNDGMLKFAEVQTSNPVEMSVDMRAEGLRNFENSGWSEDSLRLEVQIDGGDWVLLDEFQVNDWGSAMVGSETGQTFDENMTTLTYSGGVLDSATQDVQFRIVSDFTASDERVYVDNFQVSSIEQGAASEGGAPVTEDFEGLDAGATVDDQFDGFTVSAQRAGDDPTSQNDAMIFDTNHPTGGDWDLHYAGQGDALIISEDNDAHDPDDNYCGGTITFNFTDPSEVVSLNVLDVEESGGLIDCYDANGDLIKSVDIPAGSNNGEQLVQIDAQGVAVMDVVLAGSGAVDDLTYIPPAEDEACGQYDLLYTDPAEEDDVPEAPAEEDEFGHAFAAC